MAHFILRQPLPAISWLGQIEYSMPPSLLRPKLLDQSIVIIEAASISLKVKLPTDYGYSLFHAWVMPCLNWRDYKILFLRE